MSELDQLFRDARQRTDDRLETLIPTANDSPARLYEAIRWSVFAGGKRFRPALVFAVGQAFGATAERLSTTAAAIEMIHAYSLIHDDLPAMDDDDLRRGRATCHVKFDEATAILAGDILQSLAFQSVAEDASLAAEIRIKLVAEIAEAAARMVAGQQLDIEAEGEKIAVAELENIHRAKTGAMIRVSARAGAIIAAASDSDLQAVSLYAEKIGLLFQITDDLLDATQTTETLGKTAGKDLTAEKATYANIYGVEQTVCLARQTHLEALGFLDKINAETGVLRDLARYILERKS